MTLERSIDNIVGSPKNGEVKKSSKEQKIRALVTKLHVCRSSFKSWPNPLKTRFQHQIISMINFKSFFLSSLLLGLGLLFGPSTIAQQANVIAAKPVEATLSVFQVGKGADGKEALLPADKASPGDTLEYEAVYKSNSKSAVKSLTATLPLPIGTSYVPGSAKPANAQASVDGKTFAAIPLKTMDKTADGKPLERLVLYSEYRALRWALGDLPANEKLTVSARARLDSVSGSVAAPVKAN